MQSPLTNGKSIRDALLTPSSALVLPESGRAKRRRTTTATANAENDNTFVRSTAQVLNALTRMEKMERLKVLVDYAETTEARNEAIKNLVAFANEN